MSEPVTEPDMRTNCLKPRKIAAGSRADAGPGALAPGGGNPLSSVLASLETAWVSPSDARRQFAESLEGLGTAVTGAFRSQSSSCFGEADGEPYEVDYDSAEGWKADPSRINARVTASYQNPYWGY
jgi:hypothetical protein